MTRYAFRMRLFAGQEAEYERRHDEVWPEIKQLLREAGVHDFTIWLDPETRHLFALMHLTEDNQRDQLASQPAMQRWWDYMKDIMETNADASPLCVELKQVFHLD